MRSTNGSRRVATWFFVTVGAAILGVTGRSQTPGERVHIVLVGDSTVAEGGGWGLGFRESFGPDVQVTNLALNGRSSKSFLDEGAWAPALTARANYILIQFGHNDEPGKGPERETDPATTYRANLTRYVREAREVGAMPILVTSIVRRKLAADGKVRSDTLDPYVEAVRALATELHVLVIDLNTLTRTQCETLGPAGCEALGAKTADGAVDTTHLGPEGQRTVGALAAREFVRVLLPAQPGADPKSLTAFLLARRQQQAPWQPDLGTGFYRNPVIFADYSDPDVVRVGQDFYLVSSSFNASPGLPILHSRDLVNWTIVGHAAPTLPSPRYDEPKHGQGLWAPSLRFHDGRFWVYVGDPDLGVFVTTATNPRGPWEPLRLVAEARGWIDPCPLWDDDGQVYLVHAWAKSRAGFNGRLTVRRLTRDGRHLADAIEIETTVFDGGTVHPTIEGPKFYKRGGYYYIFAPAGGVTNGWQTVLRSHSVLGPYEARIVLERGRSSVNGPHQGGWVDAPDGTSWFVHFQDRGAYGRIVHLQPMVWRDDWPVMGSDLDGDGTGEPVSTFRMPVADALPRPVLPQTTDEFGSSRLGLQWQWQANAKPDWMSLSARPGYLRLFAQALPGGDPNLWSASHLLLQKLPAETFEVTTAVRLNARATGQAIALVVFGLDYAEIRLSRTASGWRLEQLTRRNADTDGQVSVNAAATGASAMQLRVSIAAGKAEFSYSPDGARFQALGESFTLREGRWVGAKFGLIATRAAGSAPGGSADIDWVRVR